jgi:hypothetical protein
MARMTKGWNSVDLQDWLRPLPLRERIHAVTGEGLAKSAALTDLPLSVGCADISPARGENKKELLRTNFHFRSVTLSIRSYRHYYILRL